MTNIVWRSPDVAILVRGWTKGESASAIGRRLGRSRNAVLGKAKRLGLYQLSPPPPSVRIERREGQAGFRIAVLSAFEGKCCVSGSTEEQGLEAAHILPYAMARDHAIENGLCLRADIHALIDCGRIYIDPDLTVRCAVDVSDEGYLAFVGTRISVPVTYDRERLRTYLTTRSRLSSALGTTAAP